LYAAVSGTTGGLFLKVFDSKTGMLAYDGSTGNLVGSPSGKSIAGWGFSPDTKDATFVHAYLTDVDRYTLVVKNLKSSDGEYVLSAPNNQGEAHWFFSPCGDYFAWIIDSPLTGLICRLYRTDSEDSYETVSAETWWKLFSAADGHYIRYIDNSVLKITDNTADETCPDKTKPTWEGATLETGLVEGTTIELLWNGAKDNVEITAYKIFKDNLLVKQIEAINSFTVTKLEPDSSFIFRVEAGDETGNLSTLASYVLSPLITDPSNQKRPDISGNLVVWWDDRNDEGDIYSYDLATDSVNRITTDPHVQFNPAVDGERIVWTDTRNGTWDIYLYDPVLGETAICTASGDQDLPAINGDIIVWRDGRNGNWDIYMCRAYDKKEFPICTNSADQTFPVITGKYGYKPAIAYMDDRNGKNIYINYPFYTSNAGFEYLVPLDPYPIISTQIYPHLEDNQLVYQDLYGVSDGVTYSIWAYQFKHDFPGYGDEIKEISIKAQINQTHPRTSKGNIVWEYDKGTDTDIYAWKRPPGSDLQLSLTEQPDPVRVGDTLKYILTIRNDGPNNNMFIQTECTIPVLVKFISANPNNGDIIIEGKTITWNIDTLKYESEARLEIIMLTYDLAILEFQASTTGGAFDPDLSNNEVYETTKVKNVIARYVDEGDEPAMVVEKNGKVHLTYFSNDTLMYATKTRTSKWEYRVLGYCPFANNSKYGHGS